MFGELTIGAFIRKSLIMQMNSRAMVFMDLVSRSPPHSVSMQANILLYVNCISFHFISPLPAYLCIIHPDTPCSQLVPYPQSQLQRRTRPRRPPDHRCPRPLHPGPQRLGTPTTSRQRNERLHPAVDSRAGEYVALGVVGESAGCE